MRMRGIRVGMLLLAAAGMSFAGEDFDAARRKHQKRIAALEKRYDEAEGERRVEVRDALGQALANGLFDLYEYRQQRAREAAEDESLQAEVDALAEEIDAWNAKLEALWAADARFARVPSPARWTPVRQGRIGRLEYLEAEALDREALQQKLHVDRKSWNAFKFGESKSGRCAYDTEAGCFEIHLHKDQKVALFFYLQSPRKQSLKVQMQLREREDAIEAVYINNRLEAGGEDERPRRRVRLAAPLHAGGNLVVVYVDNRGSPSIEFDVEVRGKELQCIER